MANENKGGLNVPKTGTPAPAPKKDESKKPKRAKEEIAKEKSEKFVTLASARTRAIIKQIRILGNCSAGNYVYTQEQVDKVFATIQDSLDKTKMMFIPKEKSTSLEATFKL
jgi:hypothetical protein